MFKEISGKILFYLDDDSVTGDAIIEPELLIMLVDDANRYHSLCRMENDHYKEVDNWPLPENK